MLISGNKFSFVREFDTAFFTHCAKHKTKEHLLPEDYDGQKLDRHLLKEASSEPETPPISIVDIDLNQPPIETNIPPTAGDTATIIEYLKEAGVRHLHITTHFHWETADDFDSLLTTVLNDESANSFKSLSLPLTLTRSIKDESIPLFFKPSTLELKSLSGRTDNLPKINKIVHNPLDSSAFSASKDIPKTARFGFAQLDSEKAPQGKLFLLAQWNDKVILHHSLVSIAQLYEVKLTDIKIHLGKYISFGKNKPQIKIDHFGCAEIPEKMPAPDTLSSNSVSDPSALESINQHVMLTSTPKGELNIQVVEDPYSKLFSFYQIKNYVRSHTVKRLPLWLEACILVELTLVCGWLYKFKGIDLHLSYILTLCFIYLAHHLCMGLLNIWMPLSACLITILTGWIFTTSFSQKWKIRRQSTSRNKAEKKELTRFD